MAVLAFSNVAAHGPARSGPPPADGFRKHRERPLRSFLPQMSLRARRGISNLSRRLWLLPFRGRGGSVCPNCWSAFGVGIGLSALVFVLFLRWSRLSKLLVSVWRRSFGAGLGRSVRTVVSYVQFCG